MKFKIVTSISVVCAMVMFFGMLVFSVDDCGKAASEKLIDRAKTASLDENKHMEVNQLMTEYMNAKQAVNMTKLESCVNDITKYKEDELKQMNRLVKKVENIKCYTIDGWEKDSYVVYLYYEYKVNSVNSNIPNLVRDIVCKDSNGKLCIFSGAMKASTVQYIESTQQNPAVMHLIQKVNDNIKHLKEKDSSVQVFYKAIEEHNNKQQNSNVNYNDANEEKKQETDSTLKDDKQQTTQDSDKKDKEKKQNSEKKTDKKKNKKKEEKEQEDKMTAKKVESDVNVKKKNSDTADEAKNEEKKSDEKN